MLRVFRLAVAATGEYTQFHGYKELKGGVALGAGEDAADGR